MIVKVHSNPLNLNAMIFFLGSPVVYFQQCNVKEISTVSQKCLLVSFLNEGINKREKHENGAV